MIVSDSSFGVQLLPSSQVRTSPDCNLMLSQVELTRSGASAVIE